MMMESLMDRKVSAVIGMTGIYRHDNGKLRNCKITGIDGKRIKVLAENCTAIWIQPEDFKQDNKEAK